MLFGLAHRAVNNATTKTGQSFSELMDTLKKFSTEIIWILVIVTCRISRQ